MAEIPIDEGARNGSYHLLIAADGTRHCGAWSQQQGAFVYSSSAAINRPIVAYLARVPGNPQQERTA